MTNEKINKIKLMKNIKRVADSEKEIVIVTKEGPGKLYDSWSSRKQDLVHILHEMKLTWADEDKSPLIEKGNNRYRYNPYLKKPHSFLILINEDGKQGLKWADETQYLEYIRMQADGEAEIWVI